MPEQQKDEILNKIVTITNPSSSECNGNTKWSIEVDGRNYSFFKNKLANKETGEVLKSKAYQYFETLGLESAGKVVEISYVVKPGVYKDKVTGEEKQTTYHNIIGMREASNLPNINTPTNGLEDRLKSLELRVAFLEGKNRISAPVSTPNVNTTQSTTSTTESVLESPVQYPETPVSYTKPKEIDVDEIPFN